MKHGHDTYMRTHAQTQKKEKANGLKMWKE